MAESCGPRCELINLIKAFAAYFCILSTHIALLCFLSSSSSCSSQIFEMFPLVVLRALPLSCLGFS